MNGAESLVRTLIAGGVEVCFANPGTSEMHCWPRSTACRGIRSVLGLFEGVVTGAADGYARMAGKPAVTLLHLGPGLANGLANVHNARRARSPMVNIVGEHATAPPGPGLAARDRHRGGGAAVLGLGAQRRARPPRSARPRPRRSPRHAARPAGSRP